MGKSSSTSSYLLATIMATFLPDSFPAIHTPPYT
jgi:hypothetical protein